jgi:hypothetical protein
VAKLEHLRLTLLAGQLVLKPAPYTRMVDYATFGFNDAANLDDGAMWPTAFALTKLSVAEEKKIVALLKKAVR